MIAKTPLDKGFEALESETTFQNISCLTILDKPVDANELIESVNNSKNRYPKLNYILCKTEEDWIYKSAQETNCTALEGPDSILSYIQALSSQFRFGKAPWQIYYSKAESTPPVLSFALHHSLGDGVSGLDFFHSLSSNDRSELPQGKKEKIKINYWGAFKHLYKELGRSKSDVGVNGKNSNKRGLILINFPYSEIQSLKKKYSTTAYPILLALVSNTISYYSNIGSRGKYLSPLLPVSIRGKNRVTDISNEIGGATISMPLGVTDVGELISVIQKELINTLNADAYYAYYIWAWVLSKLPFTLRKYLTKKSAHKTSFICTNLVGPNKEFQIAGSTIKEQYVIPALMPGHGLGFGFMKSLGKMHIALIYDPQVIRDIDGMKRGFIRAVNDYGIKEFHIR